MPISKKSSNALTIFVAAVACIIYILFLYTDYKYRRMYLNYQFDGIVENVVYNIKGIATVVIKGVDYELSDNNWDFGHNRIVKGDSMIKKKNSMIIRLVKHDCETIIEDGK